jgi:hypothetical protein
MTQVLACSTSQGIVLATDSRATCFDETRTMKHFSLKKLLRLGSHSAMISAGAGIGAEMSLSFQQFLQSEGKEVIDDIALMAVPFFSDRYGRWLNDREKHPSLPYPLVDMSSEEDLPLNEVYLILAGYSFRDSACPYPLHLFSSEGGGSSIKALLTSQIIVIPRSILMERKLEVQREKGPSLVSLLSLCKSFLKNRSAEGEEVGPPFYFATITPAGFKEISDAEVSG